MGAINDNSDGVPWHFLRQHAVESVLHAGQERERPGNSNSTSIIQIGAAGPKI